MWGGATASFAVKTLAKTFLPTTVPSRRVTLNTTAVLWPRDSRSSLLSRPDHGDQQLPALRGQLVRPSKVTLVRPPAVHAVDVAVWGVAKAGNTGNVLAQLSPLPVQRNRPAVLDNASAVLGSAPADLGSAPADLGSAPAALAVDPSQGVLRLPPLPYIRVVHWPHPFPGLGGCCASPHA